MFFKSKATPSIVVDLLNKLGISMCFRWCSDAVRSHGISERESLRRFILSGGRPLVIYDNIRLQFQKATQRVNNQTHGDNGTSATIVFLPESIYEPLRNYHQLYAAKMIENQANGHDGYPRLTFEDFVNREELDYIQQHYVYQVIKVLLDTPAFDDYKFKDSPELQPPPPIYHLPTGRAHRTRYSMLGTWPIEEATYDGNLLVLDEILKGLFGKLTDETEAKVGSGGIPGDQVTYTRDQHLLQLRSQDGNAFDRLSWMIPGFGWFHAQLNLGYSVLANHRGTHSSFGLSRDIAQIGIKGLASDEDKPNFHTVDALLLTECVARFRALWLWVTESSSLNFELKAKFDFDSESSAVEIRRLATSIVNKRASSSAIAILEGFGAQNNDPVLRQSILLNTDLLLYTQLRETIREGDVGHLEYLVPSLAMYYKGAGKPNYARLMIDYLQWSKYEAPPGIRYGSV